MVCYALYDSLLSLKFCAKSPLLSKSEDPAKVSRLDAGDADSALKHVYLGQFGTEAMLESSQGPAVACHLDLVWNVSVDRRGVLRRGFGMQQSPQLSARVNPGDGVESRAFSSGIQLAFPQLVPLVCCAGGLPS